MSFMTVILAVALCACSLNKDEKALSNAETNETETQVLDESEKELPTVVVESENEPAVDETTEDISEENYPGEDVVEIVNLRGDETTIYKLADGTYMDRIDRRFTYNGTDTWTDENGVEWNEIVK